MADYKAATVSGNSWQRCYEINISNPLDEMGIMQFREQTVVEFPNGERMVKIVPGCLTRFNPTDTITLYDPITGAETGQTMTHAEVYAILYSAYLTAANARDAV